MEKENKEFVETCSEHDLYFFIDECGAFSWRMNHDLNSGKIDVDEEGASAIRKDIEKVQEMLETSVEQVKRFGVDFHFVEVENTILAGTSRKACDEYWKWYRHWDNWKKELTNEQWDEMNAKMKRKESIEDFLPNKKWNE